MSLNAINQIRKKADRRVQKEVKNKAAYLAQTI